MPRNLIFFEIANRAEKAWREIGLLAYAVRDHEGQCTESQSKPLRSPLKLCYIAFSRNAKGLDQQDPGIVLNNVLGAASKMFGRKPSSFTTCRRVELPQYAEI